MRGRRRAPAPRAGFALIVVLALLSLLVLLVLTLTTQLQLSLVGAKQAIRQEQARQNAKYALSVALAQLQRHAGPDQRVTARADVAVNVQQMGGLPPNSVQNYWTGVWKTLRPATINQELDQGFNERNEIGANLRAWSLDNSVGTPGRDSQEAGGPQWLVSWPGPAGTGPSPRTGPSPDPKVRDLEKAVGTNQAFKTLARVVDIVNSSATLHHIRAWKVPMQDLPGGEGGGLLATGAYAYWISDEGVKAKANLVSPWPQTPGNYAESQLNFLAPQRMAIEKMLIDARPSVSATAGAKLAVPGPADPSHSRLAQVQSLSDLANLLPASAFRPDGTLAGGAPGTAYTLEQRFFPDITTWSYGVLSDVRRGGLKQDLTAAFEDTTQYQTLLTRTRNMHGDGVDDEKVYRVGAGGMPPASAGYSRTFRMDGLRWHTLYLYYNSYKPQLPNPFSGAIPSPFAGPASGPAPNPSLRMRFYTYPTGVREFALMPRMIMTQLYYGLSYDGGSKIRLHLYPAIVLYNPYNVTITAPANSLQFNVFTNAQVAIGVRRPGTSGNNYEEVPNEGTGIYDYAPALTVRDRRYMLSTALNANLNLEPGELRVYALRTDIQRGEMERIGVVTELSDRVTHVGNAIIRNVADWNNGLYAGPLNYGPGETLRLSNSDFIYSDQTGSVSVTTPNPAQLYWPQSGQNQTQELGRIMFRAFESQVNVPETPLSDYTGGNVLQLGGLAFHVKPVNPRGITINQNFSGVNFSPAPWPALPMFASVLPASSPFSNFYEGPMVDHVSEVMPGGPSTPALSLGAINEAGADGQSYLRARWGMTGDGTGGQTHVVLRDVPRQPLASLGQFMHVNANYWVSAVPQLEIAPGQVMNITSNGGTVINSPTYDNVVMHPVGGSLAPAMMRGTAPGYGVAVAGTNGVVDASLARRKKFENRLEAIPSTGGGFNSLPTSLTSILHENNRNVWFRDDNFLANETLFDSYYFSTVPAATRNAAQLPPVGALFNAQYIEAGRPLPNARMTYHFAGGATPAVANLQHFDRSAANLLLNGAFNINSTSVDAWVALLSSMSGYDLQLWNAHASAKAAQTLSAGTDLRNTSPILRFPSPVATKSPTRSATFNQPFEGIVALSDDEVRDLAVKIVEQVKLRGPFLSLGDFFNRRLSNKPTAIGADNSIDPSVNFTLMGALQAAIDNNSKVIQRIRGLPLANRVADKGTIDNWQNSNGGTLPIMHWFQNRFMYMQQMPIITKNLPTYNHGGSPKTFSAQGIPGWLMQQDLVQAFSSVMTARSDTFVIRTYGETNDPLTGAITARAYLEAVVQRFPDFVDPSVPAETRSRFINDGVIKINALADVTEPGRPAYNPLIRVFGRKFRIVSMRWLNESDI